jgi:antitoxin YefM
MGAMSFNRFRRNPAKIMDEVAETDEPLTVTRANGQDVVILSAREYEAMKETLHLLRTRKNAARLRQSLRQIAAGQLVEIDVP